jgi:hypothetical protein
MLEIKSRLKGLTDREKWIDRRTSFVAKAKATKVVWFPPKPAGTGKSATTTKKTTKRAAKKTTGTVAKAAKGTKNVADPG